MITDNFVGVFCKCFANAKQPPALFLPQMLKILAQIDKSSKVFVCVKKPSEIAKYKRFYPAVMTLVTFSASDYILVSKYLRPNVHCPRLRTDIGKPPHIVPSSVFYPSSVF